ncbi:aminoglycoside 3'-phosphotransferase [Candidatus Bathyarchaeota archaeon]|nr:aminoglycoside 3'-phosphotransferase [Candidatus Bathyarchaeota archaeon]MBT4424189.1 aminoglycoside 3'-phosphotransferase [Candidatus Bathyarchaeota archaeon]MBT7187644.1 aminoglycoside 3'-phosphotransferase [Candidatus Bathyarchaeota archaeon]MBT7347229.1 aminoglycoside 3'-phosphotransferase [Candidatus Bathyarchaeota archaeon]
MPSLPDELAGLAEGYDFSRFPYYETSAKIYRLLSEDSILYLKIIEGQQTLSLERESNILKWIDGRIPTPELLYYGVQDGNEYQLTTEIKGTATYQVQPNEREHAVKALGEALKMIHSLDPTGCPIDNRIDNRLKQLHEGGKDASHLSDRPKESLVFTHGDYCLPNIIIDGQELSGIIDWDYAGLADPYADFTSCIWSMGYNYGLEETAERWEPYFFMVYGLEDVDVGKLAYYRQLMDLFP